MCAHHARRVTQSTAACKSPHNAPHNAPINKKIAAALPVQVRRGERGVSACFPGTCGEVWSNHSAAALQRVRVAFHDALKIMTSQPRSTSNSWLFALLRLDTFDARRRKLTHSFATRLLASENDIVRALSCSDAVSTSTFWSNYCKVVHRPRARRDAM
uniref:Uncharacterized protein n=1 Tax=Branchiostoma floridae TaxID=7739 RepID=C3YGT4_BRAFL|eukprot:XP_002604394.1 hypothetical protein BRAFLDRAFT_79303 [Branchiostoma floridae]